MKKRLLLFIVLLSFSVLNAQERMVTGKVENEKSEPISGVNVQIKGAKTGTMTDATGAFRLNASNSNATLQFSYVGYESQEAKITSSGIVNIKMVPAAVGLDEIITVGYGSQKKVNVSGAIESVKGETLVKRNTMQTSLA